MIEKARFSSGVVFAVCLLAVAAMASAIGASRVAAATASPAAALPITVVPNIGNLRYTEDAVFAPNGQLLATVSEGAVKLWDIASARPLRTLEHKSFFVAIAFTPNSAVLATGHKDGTVKLWDVVTGTSTTLVDAPKPPPDHDQYDMGIRSLAVDRSGQLLATGNALGTVTLWNLKTGVQAKRLNFPPGPIRAVQISPDGSTLTAVSSDSVKIVDLRSGAVIVSAKLPANYYFAEDSIVDGRKLVARMRLAGCSVDRGALFDPQVPTQLVQVDPAPSCQPANSADYSEHFVAKIFRSPDGKKFFVTRSDTLELKLWNVQDARVERTVKWSQLGDGEHIIAVSSDFELAVTVKDWIRIRNIETGAVVSELIPYGYAAQNAIIGGDNQHIFLLHNDTQAGRKSIDVWSVNSLDPATRKLAADAQTDIWDISVQAKLAVGLNANDQVVLFSTETGALTRTLTIPGVTGIASLCLSPDGKLVGLIGQRPDDTAAALLIDVASGNLLLTLRDTSKNKDNDVTALAFSPDGKLLAAGRFGGSAEVWSTSPIRRIAALPADRTGAADQMRSLAFSSDGKFLIGGSRDSGVFLWNVVTGKWIRTFNRDDTLAGHVNVSCVTVSHDGKLIVGGQAERARSSGDLGAERGIKVWDADTGALRFTLRGHESGVRAVMFSADDRRIISGSYDGTIRYWDRMTGKWLATFTAAKNGRWVIVTESGFYAGSPGADDLVGVVRGLVPYSVSQFHDALYRPDLVDELLKGDAEGKYADASAKLNLQKILDSGPAPQLELLEQRAEQAADTVRLSVRITDVGGGIGGKVVWRVNGKTEGDLTTAGMSGSANPGRSVVMTQGLAVDPGKSNAIEVTAYNGAELLASLPLKITVDPFGVTTQERPRLYTLTIGVEEYAMTDYQLHYAVKDAKAFGDALKQVGSTLFSDVEVTGLYDADVKKDNIAATFDKLAAQIKPTDVFILFLAGHGRSIAGKYYFLQQDIDFAKNQTIERDAISQELWQTWLAKIVAQKSLLVFDTCESAAAAGLVRGGERERETAMEQLQNATGENLIAAARQAALEGYKGHGVLTYTILEAFAKPPSPTANDKIDIDGLAAYVGTQVPEITKSLYGMAQEPIRKLTGSNFPLGLRVIDVHQNSDCPDKQDFIIIGNERLREKPEDQAPGDRVLEAGYTVAAKFYGSWALVCRDGITLGYVPQQSVLKTK